MTTPAGSADAPGPQGSAPAGDADAGGRREQGFRRGDGEQSLPGSGAGRPGPAARPLYFRLLGVRYLAPTGWQRALLAEGSVVLALLIALADLASAWVLLALPLTVATVVVYHDLLEGLLRRHGPEGAPTADRQHGPG